VLVLGVGVGGCDIVLILYNIDVKEGGCYDK
jgi:hypothetical protein